MSACNGLVFWSCSHQSWSLPPSTTERQGPYCVFHSWGPEFIAATLVVSASSLIFMRRLVRDLCFCNHVHILWTSCLTVTESAEYQRAFRLTWLHCGYYSRPPGASRPSPIEMKAVQLRSLFSLWFSSSRYYVNWLPLFVCIYSCSSYSSCLNQEVIIFFSCFSFSIYFYLKQFCQEY